MQSGYRQSIDILPGIACGLLTDQIMIHDQLVCGKSISILLASLNACISDSFISDLFIGGDSFEYRRAHIAFRYK